MKTLIISSLLLVLSSFAYAESNDPMGLSDYIIRELHSDGNWYDRRLTNHEADMFRVTGFILPDGSVKPIADEGQSHGGIMVGRKPLQQTSPSSANTPNSHSAYMKEHKDKKAIAQFS